MPEPTPTEPKPTIPASRLPARRRMRGDHPTDGDALRRRVRGERQRISRLSRIREIVLGFQDGLLVPLAVVTGLAGDHAGSTAVLILRALPLPREAVAQTLGEPDRAVLRPCRRKQ